MTRSYIAAWLAIVVGVSGCDKGPANSSSVVEKSTESEIDTLVVALEIGAGDSDGPEAFGRIGSVIGDSQGRIIVADAQNSEIKVFDASGAFVFGFGRSGEGPGELLAPCCMAWAPTADLWIRDTGNGRYSIFRLGEKAASFIGTVRIEHGDADRVVPTTFRGADEFADIGSEKNEANERVLMRRWRKLDGTRVAAETIVSPTMRELGGQLFDDGKGAKFYLYQPYGPEEVIAFGPDGLLAQGMSSTYAIRVTGPTASHVLADSSVVGPALSAGEREKGEARLLTLAKRIGKTVPELPFKLPKQKPPLRQAYFDAQGRLWAETSAADAAPRLAHVWNTQGKLERTYQWPGDVRLGSASWIRDDMMLGIRTDSLGVDYVVRLAPAVKK